jgi:hypothetical protein
MTLGEKAQKLDGENQTLQINMKIIRQKMVAAEE